MAPHDDGIAPVQTISVDRRSQSGPGSPEGVRQSQVEAKAPAEGSSSASRGLALSESLGMQLRAEEARITFEKDEASGRMVVRLKDASGTVIRQIPPDEMLRLAKAIDQYLGLLVDRHS